MSNKEPLRGTGICFEEEPSRPPGFPSNSPPLPHSATGQAARDGRVPQPACSIVAFA
jgi:hypothetical protein